MKTAERVAYFNDLSDAEKVWVTCNLQLGIEKDSGLYFSLVAINPKLKLRDGLVFIHPESIDPIQKLISTQQDLAIKELLKQAFAR